MVGVEGSRTLAVYYARFIHYIHRGIKCHGHLSHATSSDVFSKTSGFSASWDLTSSKFAEHDLHELQQSHCELVIISV